MTFIEQFFKLTGERMNKYFVQRKNRDKVFANERYATTANERIEEIYKNCILTVLIKDSRTTDEFQNFFKMTSIKVDKFKREIFVNMDLITDIIDGMDISNFEAIMNLQPHEIFTYSQLKKLKRGEFTGSERDNLCLNYTVFIKVNFNKNDRTSSFNFTDNFQINTSYSETKVQIIIQNGTLINGRNPVFNEFDKKIEDIQKLIYNGMNLDFQEPIFKSTSSINSNGMMFELDKFPPEALERFNIDDDILNVDDSSIVWKKLKSWDCYYKSDEN